MRIVTEKQKANLRPKPFTSENQPEKNGRKKGVPNRATVIKKLMNIKTSVVDPKNPKGPMIQVTLLEAAALGQFQSAMKGNTNAWKEIQDSLHGKIADKTEHSGPNEGPIIATFQITTKKNDGD